MRPWALCRSMPGKRSRSGIDLLRNETTTELDTSGPGLVPEAGFMPLLATHHVVSIMGGRL